MSIATLAAPLQSRPVRRSRLTRAVDPKVRMRMVECLVGLAYDVPAQLYAEKFGISVRTVYRWAEEAKQYFRGPAS